MSTVRRALRDYHAALPPAEPLIDLHTLALPSSLASSSLFFYLNLNIPRHPPQWMFVTHPAVWEQFSLNKCQH